ncbi:MAG: hypothetical protein K2N34_09905, partial [Lachnospiraceae bacterium]|nr:hypothetical protein [Lachnospiraceae bacterium]
MTAYNEIDIKKLEKSAYDTYNVYALMGCLTKAIHDQTNDFISTEEERFLWQLKGSLEMACDILDDTTTTFFEVLEVIDRQQRSANKQT